MNNTARHLAQAAIIALATIGATEVRADDGDSEGRRNAYVVTPLVSDLAGAAAVRDPVLRNAWGVAFTPGASPFWVADNATGCATLYGGDGAKVALQVSIPLPGNVVPATACQPIDPNNPPHPTPASPTGMVWNPSTAFHVPGTTLAASFVFATGVNVHGVFLFATNFRAGTIEAYGPNPAGGAFTRATPDGSFTDPMIPAGFAPFGIQNINGDLFVTYAKQNAEKHDDVAGPGSGFVDVFDTDGHLLRRFASHGHLNSPWAVARASFAFGRFSGDILVGNFGDGRINAFDERGHFIDELDGSDGKPLAIDGLWTLTLGGGRTSSSDTLFFTAGPNGESDGLFGTITPAP